MTVFIIPPPDIVLEVRDQRFHRRERVCGLVAIIVAMVPFAGLVIVAQNADAALDIGESVFEPME
jgi:hypothetical protein